MTQTDLQTFILRVILSQHNIFLLTYTQFNYKLLESSKIKRMVYNI